MHSHDNLSAHAASQGARYVVSRSCHLHRPCHRVASRWSSARAHNVSLFSTFALLVPFSCNKRANSSLMEFYAHCNYIWSRASTRRTSITVFDNGDGVSMPSRSLTDSTASSQAGAGDSATRESVRLARGPAGAQIHGVACSSAGDLNGSARWGPELEASVSAGARATPYSNVHGPRHLPAAATLDVIARPRLGRPRYSLGGRGWVDWMDWMEWKSAGFAILSHVAAPHQVVGRSATTTRPFRKVKPAPDRSFWQPRRHTDSSSSEPSGSDGRQVWASNGPSDAVTPLKFLMNASWKRS